MLTLVIHESFREQLTTICTSLRSPIFHFDVWHLLQCSDIWSGARCEGSYLISPKTITNILKDINKIKGLNANVKNSHSGHGA